MLRSAMIAGLFLLTPVLVQAQAEKAPGIEVFGGLSYLNVAGYYEREHFFNAATGVTVKVNKHFGLTADGSLPLAGPSETFFDRGIGTRFLPPISSTIRNTTRTSTALFGPRFFLRREKTTLFAHGLAGVVRTHSESRVLAGIGFSVGSGPRLPTSLGFSINHFAYGFGGGIDVDLSRRFAIRVIQADYLRGRIEARGDQLRLQSGVVVRFGKGSH